MIYGNPKLQEKVEKYHEILKDNPSELNSELCRSLNSINGTFNPIFPVGGPKAQDEWT